MKSTVIFLLIFTLSLNQSLFSQEITLNITAEQSIPEDLQKTLNVPKRISIEHYIEAIDSLSEQLIRMGYIESFLKNITIKNDSLYIMADYFLGKKHQTIQIRYNQEDFSTKELKAILPANAADFSKRCFTTPITEIENILHKINIKKSNQGHPFTRIHLSEIENRNDTLTARLIISKNTERRIDSIVIRGYEKFPGSFLKYYAGLRKGQVLNQEKLLKSNERLQALPFTSTIRTPEILFRQDSTVVYFYLKKENNNNFDGVLGFSTDETTRKLIFNGYLNLKLNNNFNYGEEFRLNYRADGHEQLEFQTGLKLPFLFKSRIGAKTELFIFKRDSSFITTIQKHNLTYQLNSNSQLHSGYESHNSANLLNEIYLGGIIENYNSKFWTSGITTTVTQPHPLFPIKSFFSLEMAVGSRKQSDSQSKQWKSETFLTHIFNLNRSHSIFTSSHIAYIFSKSYLTNELFRLGGTQSIRGFDENSIDASFYSVINLEYRYQVNPDFFLHTITDAAYFENPNFSIKHNLYSFGFGLGIKSKSGLFRFQIANGIAPNQKSSVSTSKIHISLLTKF